MDITKILEESGTLVGILGTLFGLWQYFQRYRFEKRIKDIDTKRNAYDSIIEILNPLDELMSNHLISISPSRINLNLDAIELEHIELKKLIDNKKGQLRILEEAIRKEINLDWESLKEEDLKRKKKADSDSSAISPAELIGNKLKKENPDELVQELLPKYQEFLEISKNIDMKINELDKSYSLNKEVLEIDGNALLKCFEDIRLALSKFTAYKSVASKTIISLISKLQEELVLKVDLMKQGENKNSEYYWTIVNIKKEIENQIRVELRI